MTGISSLGIGSGLDLNTLVQGLVSAERAPVQNRLDRSQGKAQTELSAVGGLAAVVAGLQTAVGGLRDFSPPLRVAVSGSDAVSASLAGMGAGAEVSNYSVQVTTLASAQSLASDAFASADAPIGSGTWRVTVDGRETAIEVGSGVDTLRDLRDAINSRSTGVQAVLVRDGEAQRLLLTSRTSGASGTMNITVDGTLDARLASAGMNETAAARDAAFSVNGLALTASSNQVIGVIPGVTLTLNNVTEGAASANVAVSRDETAIRNTLNGLVAAYNAVQDRLRATATYNAETGQGGPLLGDAAVRTLQARLGGVFSQALPEAGNGSLLELGFSVGVDGRATLDTTRLASTLADDQAGAQARISAFANMLEARLRDYAGGTGILQARIDGLTGRLAEIADQRLALDDRMARVEQRLRAQFAALDGLIAQFQSTSTFLAGQLASIGNLRAERNR